jgi:hypothetical protein
MTTENATDTPTELDQQNDQSGGAMSTADLARAASGSTDPQPSDLEVETKSASTEGSEPLFDQQSTQSYRDRWMSVQGSFVDDPRSAVQHADELVAETIQQLAQIFADERGSLEQQWSSGQDVSTEDLRVALQRYRSFFDRLLSV